MRSRMTTILAIAALLGAGPLLSAVAFADAGDTSGTAQTSQDIVIEPGPGVQVIRPDSDVRVIAPDPELKVKVEQPGHFERQRILVKDGYYESYNVWVPKDRKGLFGLKTIPGHYEARQRWVAPQYEYRNVWVPER